MNIGTIMAEAGFVVGSAIRELEQRIVKLEKRIMLEKSSGLLPVEAVFTDDSRPPAGTVREGTRIWNSDDTAPNWSDGNDWRDSDGVVT